MDEPDDAMRDELYRRIQADIAEDERPSGWLRSRSTRVRVGLTFVVAVASIGAALGIQGALRPELSAGWALGAAGLAGVVVVAMLTAFRPLHRVAMSRTARLGLLGISVLGALGAVAITSDGSFGSLGSLACFGWGALAGAPVFLVALLLDRRPAAGVVFSGLAGGAVAALAVQTSCGAWRADSPDGPALRSGRRIRGAGRSGSSGAGACYI